MRGVDSVEEYGNMGVGGVHSEDEGIDENAGGTVAWEHDDRACKMHFIFLGMNTSRQRQQAILICVSLAVLIAAVYWQVARAGFVNYDDDEYVTANPHVLGGLTAPGVVWAFTASRLANWHPLTWLSHALDCEWFGMNAGGHHAVSVLLHLVNTVLLFLVLRRMTGATWRSACVAALFGVHPLHVESVAWVAERKDVLSGLFWMLALWGYARYVERPTRLRYAVVMGWYAMGLMAKPMVVTLPFVLLLLDYWPLGRTLWTRSVVGNNAPLRFGELVWEKVPLFALAVLSCGMTTWAQHSGGTIPSLEQLPLGARMANAVVSYVRYMEKAVWPSGLAVFYPCRAWSATAVIVAGAILVAVSATVIRRARRDPHLAVGWFWFLGVLVPAIGLVQVGAQSMADRYTYLPLIGLFIMLSWSVPSRAMERRNLKVITCVAAAAVLAVCAALSRVQVGYWKDSETLFRHALDLTRDNWVAHNNLALVLTELGRVREAKEHYEESLQINPRNPGAHNNLGELFLREGKVGDAIGHYEQALRISPDYADAHGNLGNVFLQEGKVGDAIGHYEQALRIKPESFPAHYNLGNALLQEGKVGDAIGHYEQALRIKPDYAQAHCNLGNALLQEGKVSEAIGHYEQALRIKPDYAEAHSNLGIALAQTGKIEEAIAHYEQALRIKPDFAEAYYALGLALWQEGKAPEAVSQWQQALHVQPDYAEAHGHLAIALEQTHSVREAIEHYEQALRVKPDYVMAQNNLAWLLATLAPAEGGDPVRAVGLAERACKLTSDRVAPYLDTLAAAYAASGRFTDAVATAQEAVDLARSVGQTQVVSEIQTRLELYRSGRAYHAPASGTSPPAP